MGKKPSSFYRWAILIVISLAMFGNYYIYDCISPLADLLMKQLHFTYKNVGSLNAIYSLPNILLVLVGGILIDKIGIRKAIMLFAVLMVIGAIITTLRGDIAWMIAGRLIFGLGAESMIIAVNTIIAKWFKGKELSFAFGLNLTIARLGSFTALNSATVFHRIYDYWQKPLIVAAAAAVICFISLFIYVLLEANAIRKYQLFVTSDREKIVFRELFSFRKSYWLITLLCFTFYSGIFPFQTFLIRFFKDVHNHTDQLAGFLSSLITLTAMVLTPIIGLIADIIGKRSTFMIIGSLLMVPVYLLLFYSSVNPYVIMIMLGTAFSVIPAVMWPSVALITEEYRLGTAYGFMTMIQSIGLAGFNILIGWANDFAGAGSDHPQGYALMIWIFSSLGIMALTFSILLRKNEAGPNAYGLEKGSLDI